MLASTDPHEAYRRSAFDARVQSGDTAALVLLCLEQAIAGLGGALLANERGRIAARSKAGPARDRGRPSECTSAVMQGRIMVNALPPRYT